MKTKEAANESADRVEKGKQWRGHREQIEEARAINDALSLGSQARARARERYPGHVLARQLFAHNVRASRVSRAGGPHISRRAIKFPSESHKFQRDARERAARGSLSSSTVKNEHAP